MNDRRGVFLQSFLLVLNATLFMITLEWLFFATKPSFFSLLTFIGVIQALAVAACPLLLVSTALFLILLPFTAWWEWGVRLAACIVSSSLATVGVVLMLDGVSVTLLGVGIRDSKDWSRLVCCAGIVCLWIELGRVFVRTTRTSIHSRNAIIVRMIPSLLVLLFGMPMYAKGLFSKPIVEGIEISQGERRMPNILLFAADGVRADSLSLYGYDRNTTPHLNRLAQNRALLIENVTTNSTISFSSDISLLTGKLPTTTRVLFPPQTLAGVDRYQHLPGILKRLGYKTFQSSTRHYADAFQAGMEFGFDSANRRRAVHQPAYFLRMFDRPVEGLFLNAVYNRILTRMMHLFGVRGMDQEFAEMSNDSKYVLWEGDRARERDIIEFIQSTEEPFFAHVHLMATHCCKFVYETTHYSVDVNSDPEQDERNRYDDAIKFTDDIFGQIISTLKKQEKLDTTIIVYSSDHADHWGVVKRIPLLFLFPDATKQTTRKNNAQLTDVAPTLLDYLGQPIPGWMEGVSLLYHEPPPLRELHIVDKLRHRQWIDAAGGHSLLQLADPGPPTYGLRSSVLKICNHWYRYDLGNQTVTRGLIPNHSAPCARSLSLLDAGGARKVIKQHLAKRSIQRGAVARRK